MGAWRSLFEKRQASLSLESFEKYHTSTEGLVVLITGSTGSLGSYLLDHFLTQQWVAEIICLNRRSDIHQSRLISQIESHTARGLSTNLRNVSFYQADLNRQDLDLADEDYLHLSRTVDVVIHLAWPVDFNRNFNSFRPSIDGVQHLIDFCLARRERPARFVFVSSVGATSNWGAAAPSSRAKIPEQEITDWKVARTGYGQSKLLSERLISLACRRRHLQAAVVRSAQLGGPVLHGEHGKWTEREWLPSLVRSSITLQALPEDFGPGEDIDWVPVDYAAVALSELTENLVYRSKEVRAKHEAMFYNLANPHSTPWRELVPSVKAQLGPGVRLTSFVEWVTLLKDSVDGGFQGMEAGLNPAVKLLDFFDHLQDRTIRFPKARAPLMESKRAVQSSPTLANLEPVGPQWMELWMRQWNWTGTGSI